MLPPKDLLVDLQSFFVQRFGFGIIAQLAVQQGQVIDEVAVSELLGPRKRLAMSTAFSARGIAS